MSKNYFDKQDYKFCAMLCLTVLFAPCRTAAGSNIEQERAAGPNQTIHVNAGSKGIAIDPNFFGISLLFFDLSDNAMADGTIEKRLRDLPAGFLRFPGGTVADNYLWDEHRLYDKSKWPFRDGPRMMDTDRFIALCRRVKAEPLICVNTELAFFESQERAIKLAADWVRYCNIEKGYNIRCWEIGNEPYWHTRFAADEYASLAVKMSRAMKTVDPTIKTSVVGIWSTAKSGIKERMEIESVQNAQRLELLGERGKLQSKEQLQAMRTIDNASPWWPQAFKIAGSEFDLMSIHWYYPLEYLPNMTRWIENLQKLSQQSRSGHALPIIITEWNVSEHAEVKGMERALGVAEGIGRMLQAGVQKANYWPFRSMDDDYQRGLINPKDNSPTVNYQVMQLIAQNVGQYLISTDCDSQATYQFASADNNGSVSLFLINRSSQIAHFDLTIEGIKDKSASVITVAADKERSSESAIRTESAFVLTNRKGKFTLPAYSLTLIKCK